MQDLYNGCVCLTKCGCFSECRFGTQVCRCDVILWRFDRFAPAQFDLEAGSSPRGTAVRGWPSNGH